MKKHITQCKIYHFLKDNEKGQGGVIETFVKCLTAQIEELLS